MLLIILDNVFKYFNHCKMFSIQFCSVLNYIVLVICWLETLYTIFTSRRQNLPRVSAHLHVYKTITKISYSNKIYILFVFLSSLGIELGTLRLWRRVTPPLDVLYRPHDDFNISFIYIPKFFFWHVSIFPRMWKKNTVTTSIRNKTLYSVKKNKNHCAD